MLSVSVVSLCSVFVSGVCGVAVVCVVYVVHCGPTNLDNSNPAWYAIQRQMGCFFQFSTVTLLRMSCRSSSPEDGGPGEGGPGVRAPPRAVRRKRAVHGGQGRGARSLGGGWHATIRGTASAQASLAKIVLVRLGNPSKLRLAKLGFGQSCPVSCAQSAPPRPACQAPSWWVQF